MVRVDERKCSHYVPIETSTYLTLYDLAFTTRTDTGVILRLLSWIGWLILLARR
jgi:hypothetical protein